MSWRKFWFYTPKNWERKKYQPLSLVTQIPRPIVDGAMLLSEIIKQKELRGWNLVCASSSDGVRLCKHNHSGLGSKVSITLSLDITDCKSSVYICGVQGCF